MPIPIIQDPRPLLTFADAPLVAIFTVGVVAGVVLCVAFAGIAVLRQGIRPARHRPTLRRRAVVIPDSAVARPPKHTVDAIVATTALQSVHPSYLGPDGVFTDRRPVTTGGAR